MPAPDEQLQALYEEIETYPGVRDAAGRRHDTDAFSPLIPLDIEYEGRVLSWFSMIATIGTPQDITLDEIRIESLFPADEATREMARAMARDD